MADATSAPATIRVGREEDYEAIVALVNLAYRVESDPGSPVGFKNEERISTDEQRSRFRAALVAGRALVATGSDERDLIGVVYHEKHDGDVPAEGSEAEAGWLHFGPFAIHPSQQGRGLARRFLAALEEVARAEGCQGLEMTVVNFRTDLIPMYEHLGFREVERIPFRDEDVPPSSLTRSGGFFLKFRRGF